MLKRIALGAATFLASAMTLTSGAQAQAWEPTDTIEIVAPSAPGGGNDRTGRTIQEILRELGIEDTVVSNMPGAGGARAYAYTHESEGNPHVITVTRTGLSSNHIIGRAPINHNDLTVIAMVLDDTQALAVKADSPLKDVNDFMDALREDPQSVGISVGSSRAAVAEILVARIAQEAGVDPTKLKIVTFSGSAEGTAALLGGHVDMVSTPIRAVVEFVRSGDVRVLALAAPDRPAALQDTPTLIDQGLDITQNGWTAITAPPGLTDEQVDFWVETFEKVTEHPKWTELEDGRFVDHVFIPTEDAVAYLNNDYNAVKTTLSALGVAD